MAVSDWVFSNSVSASNAAQIYSTPGIPAPPGGGSYCRRLSTAASPLSSFCGFYPADPSLSDVPYLPNPKAIRVQCMFYYSDIYNKAICLSLKNNPVVGGNGQVSGYSLMAWGAPTALVRNNVSITLGGTPATNTWHSWRISVYPIGPAIDRIIAEFESSPGSGIWSSNWPTTSGDVTFNNSSAAYIPWGSRGASQSRNGVWFSSTQNNSAPAYIDNLKVSMATVPAPLP
jgi:hypothetical protein